MKINSSKLSFFTYCLLLPLLHLQSYFAGAGVFPVIRGRIFIILFLAVFMGIIFLKKKFTIYTIQGSFLFLVILLISLSIVLFNFNIYDNSGRSAFFFNILIVFMYVVYFIAGFFLDNLEQRKKWIIFFWLLMIGNLIFHYDFRSMSISLDILDNDTKGIYLFLGDSFALWSLLLLSLLQKRPLISICVFFISAFILFLFVSRASLYAFIVVVPLIIYFTKKSLKYYFFIFILLILYFIYENMANITEINSRMLVFQDLNADPSVKERIYIFKEGFSGIKQHWFWGDYAGQAKYGNLGSYIHNYLSLWRQFGLVPFISFCLLICFFISKTCRVILSVRKNRKLSPDDFFLVIGGSFCLIEILVARSYTSAYIWLFLGMTLKRRNFNKSNFS